jgi:succinoglycan biosynthesis protein ExoL
MTRIAFFGHDAADAAIRRRVRGFLDDGLQVTGFMMRRRDPGTLEYENVDLGETRDGAFVQRIRQVFAGARRAAADRAKLAAADVIYARNLDMLACAFLARRHAGLVTPVIYESLDVHRLLTRSDFIGKAMRRLERSLLKRTVGLVVSSPGFIRNHFEKHYAGDYRAFLVENRLAPGASYGLRPGVPGPGACGVTRPLRLGWVGNLRCKRSFELLCQLADQFLAGIYDNLDVVWAGDFMEAGYNSVWLLPNRIYEGGYYCTPSIAPSSTETAAWLTQHDCGILVDEPLDQTLPQLIASLVADRGPIAERAAALARAPDNTFIQPPGFLASIVACCLSRSRTARLSAGA